MFEINCTEMVGYTASAMVALSFIMKDMTWLRIINCVGCLLFVGYGTALHSWPVILTNGLIAGIHACYLARLKIHKKAEASRV